MRRINKLNFEELVEKNKEELINDKKAMEKLKEKLDEKIEERMFNKSKSFI